MDIRKEYLKSLVRAGEQTLLLHTKGYASPDLLASVLEKMTEEVKKANSGVSFND